MEEYGKWIAFAFLAGAVLVGFKSRQLKAYEFIVSGLFLLLLDRLVFHGQISDWIGQLGSKAKGAAAHSALHSAAHAAVHGAMVFPFLLTGAGGKARRMLARVWAHRPNIWELAAYLAGVLASHWILGLSWPVGAAIFTAALVLELLWYAATDRDHDGEHDDRDHDGQDQGAATDARRAATGITPLPERRPQGRPGAGER